jgi:hypothetical protein
MAGQQTIRSSVGGSVTLTVDDTLTTDEVVEFNGDGVILVSPNGTKYVLKVADDGTLTTEEVV